VQSLFIYMNTAGRWIGDGVEDGRDFWPTLNDAPDTIAGASSPPSQK
jgi:hypothetical protein